MSASSTKWADYASVGLIVGACGLRLYLWLANPSLWLDECYLAVNILDRPFGQLHRLLEYDQSAPYLFLLATKCVVALFGPGELALRLLPLAASIASLWLFWRLVNASLPEPVVPVVVAIFAFAYQPLCYAHELKQYSVELFAVTLVLWLTVRVFRHSEAPKADFAALAVTGGIGIFAAHPMPFVLAGVGLAAGWARYRRSLNLPPIWLLLAIAAWLALTAVNYAVIIAPVYGDRFMKAYWAFAYPALPFSPGGLRSWFVLVDGYLSYLGYGYAFKALFGIALLGGAWFGVRTRHGPTVAALLTGGIYWLAALAGRAPFYGRLLLFLFPLLILVAGKGLEWLLHRVRWWIFALGAGALLIPTITTLPRAIRYLEKEDLRDPILYLAKSRRESEPVYVQFWAQPAFRYYREARRLASLAAPPVVFGGEYGRFGPAQREGSPPPVWADTDRIAGELAPLQSRQPFWVLVAHSDGSNERLLGRIHETLGLAPAIKYRATECSLYYFGAAGVPPPAAPLPGREPAAPAGPPDGD